MVSPDIDLRLFLGGWASVFAVEEQGRDGVQRSIQVFDRQGMAVHKVYLTERSTISAWAPLIERFRAERQSAELDLEPLATREPVRPDTAIDARHCATAGPD